MRLLLFTIALALLSTGAAGQSPDQISLASWNVRILSDNSRSDAELGIIALIIFRYDFIALQEVRDEKVVKRIQKILRDDFQVNYEIDVSSEVGTDTQKERYAFMWRANKIQQTFGGKFFIDTNNQFVREPYCASFKADTFDWTLCTVHILFGNGKTERRPEIQALDDVYRAAHDANGERDIVICGDFNFDPNDSGWTDLKQIDSMQFAISPPAKTTIADRSLYDNCWWPEASTEIIGDTASVYEFDELMFPPGSRKEANRLTSDHRPISVIALPLPADDD